MAILEMATITCYIHGILRRYNGNDDGVKRRMMNVQGRVLVRSSVSSQRNVRRPAFTSPNLLYLRC